MSKICKYNIKQIKNDKIFYSNHHKKSLVKQMENLNFFIVLP